MATLKIVGGSLLLHSPELPNGLVAEGFELTFDQPAPPGPRVFEVRLTRPGGESLTVAGQLDPASAPALAVTADRWAADVTHSGLAASAVLDGKAVLDLRGGTIAATGDVRVSRAEVAGAALAGDRVRLDHVEGAWDVALGETGWTVRRLDLSSPIATLKSDRPIPAPPGGSATITGRFDLAALAKQAPHALWLREGLDLRTGTADVRVGVREDAGRNALRSRLASRTSRPAIATAPRRSSFASRPRSTPPSSPGGVRSGSNAWG